MASRIKGQDTEILMVRNGVVEGTITAVRSFEFTYQLEVKSEGYIGETTDRKDSTFKGIKGNMDVHHETKVIWDIFTAIVDKARRRTPGVRINVKTSFNYPNGDRKRVIIPDCEFGDIPVNVSSRMDYVSSKFDFESSEARPL